MEEKNSKDRCSLPPTTSSTPWLVYTHGKSRKKKMQTFCTPSSKNEYYFKSIPELREKLIVHSNNGWLLLRDLNGWDIFSLWNPFSSSPVITFPRLFYVDISCCLMLPYDDDDVDNFIVYLFTDDGLAFYYHPFRENSFWAMRRTHLRGKPTLIRDVVTCNGIVYGFASLLSNFGKKEELVVIEINDTNYNHGNYTDTPLNLRPFLAVEESDYGFRSSLVESCDNVYNVRIHMSGSERITGVHVWQLNLRLMKWVAIEGLHGRAFFIGNDSKCSTWCWGSGTDNGDIQGNCVYFILYDDGEMPNPLHSYNLSDSSLTSILPCPNLPYPFFPSPTWVMPPQCQSYTLVIREEVGKYSIEGIRSQVNEDEESLLCELPYDLISRVTQHLDLVDCLNFRASNKLLKDIIPPATWGTNTTYLEDFFLLRLNTKRCLEFFNPFTRVRGEIPCQCQYSFSSVGFTTCPTSSACVAIGIKGFYFKVIVGYLTVGDKRWQYSTFPQIPGQKFRPGTSRPLYYEGSFYFLDIRGYLGVFQLIYKEGLRSWKVYGKPQLPSSCHSCHLVECDGMLLSVFMEDTGKWVRVFRLKLSKMKWVCVKCLGNFTLFLSPSSSLAVVATEPDMRNRIYLSRWRGDGILFYCLDMGKYNTKGGDWIEDFSGTKEYLKYWI